MRWMGGDGDAYMHYASRQTYNACCCYATGQPYHWVMNRMMMMMVVVEWVGLFLYAWAKHSWVGTHTDHAFSVVATWWATQRDGSRVVHRYIHKRCWHAETDLRVANDCGYNSSICKDDHSSHGCCSRPPPILHCFSLSFFSWVNEHAVEVNNGSHLACFSLALSLPHPIMLSALSFFCMFHLSASTLFRTKNPFATPTLFNHPGFLFLFVSSCTYSC